MPKSPFLQKRPSVTAAGRGFPVVRYAFGSVIKERTTSYQSTYRYGFNNQEKDVEMGEYYAFEYRVHDARIGRFLSVDPLRAEYPWNSTYAFAENTVIWAIELEGCEAAFTARNPKNELLLLPINSKITKFSDNQTGTLKCGSQPKIKTNNGAVETFTITIGSGETATFKTFEAYYDCHTGEFQGYYTIGDLPCEKYDPNNYDAKPLKVSAIVLAGGYIGTEIHPDVIGYVEEKLKINKEKVEKFNKEFQEFREKNILPWANDPNNIYNIWASRLVLGDAISYEISADISFGAVLGKSASLIVPLRGPDAFKVLFMQTPYTGFSGIGGGASFSNFKFISLRDNITEFRSVDFTGLTVGANIDLPLFKLVGADGQVTVSFNNGEPILFGFGAHISVGKSLSPSRFFTFQVGNTTDITDNVLTGLLNGKYSTLVPTTIK